MPFVGLTTDAPTSLLTRPQVNSTSASAEEKKLFITVILALGAIIVFLVVALVTICCLYRKPRKHLQRNPDDPFSYDAAITNKHIPVIFAEEMDDDLLASPVSRPLILPDERPPATLSDEDDLSLPEPSNGFARIAFGNTPAPPS